MFFLTSYLLLLLLVQCTTWLQLKDMIHFPRYLEKAVQLPVQYSTILLPALVSFPPSGPTILEFRILFNCSQIHMLPRKQSTSLEIRGAHTVFTGNNLLGSVVLH
jgi:hypothetical protein